MGIPELIVLACIAMNPTPDCQKFMFQCVTGKRIEAVKSFVKDSTSKHLQPEDMILNAPNGDYVDWVLTCAKNYKDGGTKEVKSVATPPAEGNHHKTPEAKDKK